MSHLKEKLVVETQLQLGHPREIGPQRAGGDPGLTINAHGELSELSNVYDLRFPMGFSSALCFILRAPRISERSTEPLAETNKFKRSTWPT